MGKSNDDYYSYAPPHLEYESAAALSDSNLVVLFAFEGKEAVATAVGYTNLVFIVFSWGYLLVLFHWCWYCQRRRRYSSWEKSLDSLCAW